MNDIELYRFDDLHEKYQRLLPKVPSGVMANGKPLLEQREGRWAMFVPATCLAGWSQDLYDGKAIALWADGWERLQDICMSLDAHADPAYVRLTDDRVLVFGRG